MESSDVLAVGTIHGFSLDAVLKIKKKFDEYIFRKEVKCMVK